MIKQILLSSLLLLSLASCSPSDDSKDEKSIKLSMTGDPATLDPRIHNELNGITVSHLLFDGLMRRGDQGKVSHAIANNVVVSEDLKVYTFTLRNALWSNGDPVTSFDFAYAWKKVLTPDFPSRNPSIFYSIRGAEQAKKGEMPLDEIGISTPDAQTLVVTLEQPTPYFLELTALHTYFPVNEKWEQSHPNWAESGIENFVGNGPFALNSWKHQDAFSFKKNPSYWDSESVELDSIEFLVLDEATAFSMFQNNELDWAGLPLTNIPTDALESLDANNSLNITPCAATFLLRFNSTDPLLKNANIRKALSYTINRNDLIDHVTQSHELPATGIVPPQIALSETPYFIDGDTAKAVELFQQGLTELGITHTIPTLKFIFQANGREAKIVQALQQQWESTLPIKVELQGVESKVFFSDVRTLNYQIATGSWFCDFCDPINFLELFETAEAGTNRTKWSHPEYTSLLRQSSHAESYKERLELMSQAEALLMDEMPIAPIFFYTFPYVKNAKVKGVLISDLGYLDFKDAIIE